MSNIFNLHLSKKQYISVPTEQTSKIYNLMVCKGDIQIPKKLERPTQERYEEISFTRFLESRVIPTNLYDATLMSTGDWYYTRYTSWFDDFLLQVFRLGRRSLLGSNTRLPSEEILDEQPGAYFFLSQLDAYRRYKDAYVASNLSHVFAQGHIAPLLFILNYAESTFEQRHQDTGEPRKDNYRGILAGNTRSDEQIFRTQVLKASYACFQSDLTEKVVRGWNNRVRKYHQQQKH